MEEIRIRVGHMSREQVLSNLAANPIVPRPNLGLTDVRLYVRLDVETDLCIHLHWNVAIPSAGSDAAAAISSGLGATGLVSHTVWHRIDAE